MHKNHQEGFSNRVKKKITTRCNRQFRLNRIYTLRIHLDDTDENNGTLKIIPDSHLNGVNSRLDFATLKPDEVLCPVFNGGVMLMRPFLLHSSSKSSGQKPRGVVHLQFADCDLPIGLNWTEKMYLD